jgi:putative acyl-CoA dehydrogenase
MRREPGAIEAFLAEIEAAPRHPALDRAAGKLKDELALDEDAESRARRVVGLMAVVLEASLLLRHGDPDVFELFLASRLDREWGHTFGTLPPSSAHRTVVERHRPRY